MIPASAQVTFDGVEYSSMSGALSAVNGTVEPGWLTPERMEALGDVLADMASQIVGDLANLAISRRAPGGVLGQETTDAILNDQIANLTRSAIEYLRTRPDERPMLEQLMEQAGVEYDAIDPELFLYRGAEGYFEYELTFLRHIQQQLTLRAAAEGRSTIPNVWLSGQIAELEMALADLRQLEELDVSPEPETDQGTCLVTETELFDYFLDQSGGGIMFANNSVIAVSNAPTTEPLGATGPDGVYQYRISEVELCGELISRR